MNFLKYYSLAIISLFTAIVFVDWIAYEDATSFFAFIVYVPILVYLYRMAKK